MGEGPQPHRISSRLEVPPPPVPVINLSPREASRGGEDEYIVCRAAAFKLPLGQVGSQGLEKAYDKILPCLR
jgi:hypothetical protein